MSRSRQKIVDWLLMTWVNASGLLLSYFMSWSLGEETNLHFLVSQWTISVIPLVRHEYYWRKLSRNITVSNSSIILDVQLRSPTASSQSINRHFLYFLAFFVQWHRFLFDLPAFYFSMCAATSSIWLRLCVSHTCNSWLRLCVGQPPTGLGLCVCPVVDRLDFASSIRFFWNSRLQGQLDFLLLSTSTLTTSRLTIIPRTSTFALILTTSHKVVDTLVGDLVSFIYFSFWSFYSVLAYILIFTDILTDRFLSQNFMRMSFFWKH